jgi:hypothetical protein
MSSKIENALEQIRGATETLKKYGAELTTGDLHLVYNCGDNLKDIARDNWATQNAKPFSHNNKS